MFSLASCGVRVTASRRHLAVALCYLCPLVVLGCSGGDGAASWEVRTYDMASNGSEALMGFLSGPNNEDSLGHLYVQWSDHDERVEVNPPRDSLITSATWIDESRLVAIGEPDMSEASTADSAAFLVEVGRCCAIESVQELDLGFTPTFLGPGHSDGSVLFVHETTSGSVVAEVAIGARAQTTVVAEWMFNDPDRWISDPVPTPGDPEGVFVLASGSQRVQHLSGSSVKPVETPGFMMEQLTATTRSGELLGVAVPTDGGREPSLIRVDLDDGQVEVIERDCRFARTARTGKIHCIRQNSTIGTLRL